MSNPEMSFGGKNSHSLLCAARELVFRSQAVNERGEVRPGLTLGEAYRALIKYQNRVREGDNNEKPPGHTCSLRLK